MIQEYRRIGAAVSTFGNQSNLWCPFHAPLPCLQPGEITHKELEQRIFQMDKATSLKIWDSPRTPPSRPWGICAIAGFGRSGRHVGRNGSQPFSLAPAFSIRQYLALGEAVWVTEVTGSHSYQSKDIRNCRPGLYQGIFPCKGRNSRKISKLVLNSSWLF